MHRAARLCTDDRLLQRIIWSLHRALLHVVDVMGVRVSDDVFVLLVRALLAEHALEGFLDLREGIGGCGDIRLCQLTRVVRGACEMGTGTEIGMEEEDMGPNR